jgi:conjugal transfer/entry exclusion protein
VSLFAATILSLPVAFSPVFATPAAAQWVVHDPTNCVQNVPSAAQRDAGG